MSQTSKILKLLKEKGSVTNIELNRICFRYSARILELRKDGYAILSERTRLNNGRVTNVWKYTLIQEDM